MALARLIVAALRNVRHADLTLSPGLNVLVGPNGSGKSSVLEAIHLLSQGRSFRAGGARQLISHGEKELAVSAVLRGGRRLGISLSGGDRRRRLDGQPCERQSELAASLPVVILQPSAQILLESSPELRRQYVDWGAFQAEGQGFLANWRRYMKCLEQRNALLRSRTGGAALEVWDAELGRYGAVLAQARGEYLGRLAPFLLEAAARLSAGAGALQLTYEPGWPADVALEDALRHAREKDRRLGYTSLGPHRGDFRLAFAGMPVRHVLSRGQLKLAVAALKVAQARLAQSSGAAGDVCLLVDDLSAELDATNRRVFWDYLREARLQALVTGTDADQFVDLRFDADAIMFHVEHGAITPA